MSHAPLALLCLGVLAAAGCHDASSPPPPEKEPLPETSLHAPIEKARAVEAQLMRARDEQDAALEEQGG